MKVLHLNYSDINGGAARAGYRIHRALHALGVDSSMLVNVASSGDSRVKGPRSVPGKVVTRARPGAAKLLRLLLRSENPVIHSPAILPSDWVKQLNASDADVVNMHWVGKEMLSIADIGRIDKPVVWTLHDMWAFCGAEHYTEDYRWREGYCRDNRPAHESGFDLNRWAWRRKCRHWRRPIHIVTPSHWLGDCVRESALMRGWPISVVPNCLDTECWRPLPQSLARELLGLPDEVPLLLFGAMGGASDPRKGFDLLTRALNDLRGETIGLEVVVFGQLAPRNPPDLGFPVHYFGQLRDDASLRTLYSAANVLVLPSRQDNLPNTGVEAQACGTPLVAFNTGGLPDIVEHGCTGYLAKAFEPADLARGIVWALKHPEPERIGEQARERAVTRFSYAVVAEQYLDVYEQAVGNYRSACQNSVIPMR